MQKKCFSFITSILLCLCVLTPLVGSLLEQKLSVHVNSFKSDVVYESNGSIILSPELEVGNDASSPIINGFFETQVEILESRNLLARAHKRVEVLNPDLSIKDERFKVVAGRKGESNVLMIYTISPDSNFARLVLDALMEEYTIFKQEQNPKYIFSILNRASVSRMAN